MMTKRLMGALLAVLVTCLASCVSAPTDKPALQFKAPTVTFVRDQNQAGSTVLTTVSINDWVIGTLAPGEYIRLQFPAGMHRISVKDHTETLTLKSNRDFNLWNQFSDFNQLNINVQI